MSYDSAVLIRIDRQENVTYETFMNFIKFLHDDRLLVFSSDGVGDVRPAHAEYFFYDDDTDEEEESSMEINSISDVEAFIQSKALEYCSISINGSGASRDLEAEFNDLLEALHDSQQSDMKAAYEFGYGFGNVLDPVAGDREGWSFYINTSGYVPNFELLEKTFSQGRVITRIRSSIEQIFNTTTQIQGCLTG